MKCRFIDAAGRLEPGIVIEAETEEEKILMKAFLYTNDNSKEKGEIQLAIKGQTLWKSFNFGWEEVEEKIFRINNDEFRNLAEDNESS